MGKKRINKKINQRHDPDDNYNPTTTSTSSSTLLYWISNKMDPNDYISHLPDNILHHIISFLPFESGVRTSFLSTHWKHLWKEALLEPVHYVITMEAATKIIQSFVDDFDTHYRPRNKWGFRFEFPHGTGVLVASISSKGALQLDFSDSKQELPGPFDLFLKLNLASANHLSPPHMWFDWWQLEQNHPLQTKQPSWNTMKVKSLYLISVSQLSNMAVSSLVPNLPFLQSLTIAKCNGLRSLQIKEAKGLLKLVVLDCPGLQSLSFEGVSLKSFRYRGNLVSFKVSCKCKPIAQFCRCDCGLILEDVMVDLRQGHLTQWTWDFQKSLRCLYHYDFYKKTRCRCTNRKRCFKSILISIRGIKSLTICRWFFETSMCNSLPFPSSRDLLPSMSQLEELWWIDCSMERESINALLCFLKLCPNLERLFVTLDDLKAVKLEGFEDEEKENFIARRLIPLFGENNPVIISKSGEKCIKHLVKVAKLEKKGKYPYKFKVVENVNENSPDHVHMKV
ncbi:F-box protein [Gossypium australe]|uniref:F-box protein n=1 Tax=Gossypium australe TaxID=47621 RepID=A0A5B6U7L8_9ROSI|nr:F-box protein [Gossypium australe]